MKHSFIKNILKTKLSALLIVAGLALIYIPSSTKEIYSATDANGNYIYPTKEQAAMESQILREMSAQGYTYDQMRDEIDEKVYNQEGKLGTGGRDGLLLDGSPAPNAPGNSGNTAPAATPKPSCNHNYTSEVTREATCTENGKVTYTCSLCGKTYSENTAKTDHNFIVTEEVTGTCIETGYRTETCTVCGLEQTIEGLYGDHDLHEGANKEDPTCLETGYTTEVCSICNEVFTTELPALGHEFETTYTVDAEPTCTEGGLQSHHCARCEETIEPMTLGALGHSYVTEITEPTFFKDGLEKCYCERCGAVSYETPIESLADRNIVPICIGIAVLGVVIFVVVAKVVGRQKK